MSADQNNPSDPQVQPRKRSGPAGGASAGMSGAGNAHEGRGMAMLAAAVPWTMSLLFHAALFLAMFFIILWTRPEDRPEELIVPEAHYAETPGGRMMDGSSLDALQPPSTMPDRNTIRQEPVETLRENLLPQETIDLGGGGVPGGALALGSSGPGAGPKSSFFGKGGNAHNVVYVIDRSGSMVGSFSDVKMELLRSIGRLEDFQNFHVVFFSSSQKPLENAGGQLIPATRNNKRITSDFLKTVDINTAGRSTQAHRTVSTQVLPALKRAFRVLQNAEQPRSIIYLLTDGTFAEATQDILASIESQIPGRSVQIHTFLFGYKLADSETVLRAIAEKTGGDYTFVEVE